MYVVLVTYQYSLRFHDGTGWEDNPQPKVTVGVIVPHDSREWVGVAVHHCATGRDSFKLIGKPVVRLVAGRYEEAR
jgi:hypothetical protein